MLSQLSAHPDPSGRAVAGERQSPRLLGSAGQRSGCWVPRDAPKYCAHTRRISHTTDRAGRSLMFSHFLREMFRSEGIPTIESSLFTGHIGYTRRSILQICPWLVFADEVNIRYFVSVSLVSWGVLIGGGRCHIIAVSSARIFLKFNSAAPFIRRPGDPHSRE
jgi:hypothetical protein